ncbi:unnamed protein product [Mycena citricolor]|uniref:Major facilitator superfamily (MFS) profile domain-containing protein n=1 Tax=Mycena citricolor TaxID=2018698 RepID=A0AAD2Q5J1_9AGAR|nr:unnamed protein product [Mycena citricolor]
MPSRGNLTIDSRLSRRSFSFTSITMPADSETQIMPSIIGPNPPADSTNSATTRRDFGFLPVPRCAHLDSSGEIGYARVLSFAFAATFIQLAQAFQVDDFQVSRIPILLQAGYATGLLFIAPLGDIFHRRQLVLILIVTSGALTVGLALTRSLVAFEVLSFLTAVATVTPQVLIPLTADLAPANRRATFIALVIAGLLTGVLAARVLAGIITQYSSYHNVYWMGAGGQFLLAIVLYLVAPPVPVKNEHLSYWQIMASLAKFAVTEPILVQGCLIFFCSEAVFSGFWVTMTFLLDGEPYNYSTLVIGIFGLVGLAGIGMSPLIGRAVDNLVPWAATFVSVWFVIASQIVETFGAEKSIAAVIVATLILDVGSQATQVSLTAVIFEIDPSARARLNTLLVGSIFLGQVAGTAIGTKLYVSGGYKLSSGIRVVFAGLELLVLLARGPHAPRHTWFGWAGGMNLRKSTPAPPIENGIPEAGVDSDEKHQ